MGHHLRKGNQDLNASWRSGTLCYLVGNASILSKKDLFYMSDRNCCKYDGIIHTAELAVETRWVKVQGILFIYILYIILYINDVS